jgi:hypothetical protein
MLQVTVPEFEVYSSEENLFTTIKEQTLAFEHSLLSISKWEAYYCKPFLSKTAKSSEETIYYLRCMCLTPNVNPIIFKHLPSSILDQVKEYIDTPKTATWFSDESKNSKSAQTLTSELLYYHMIANGIPFECQKWHLSRLITLIRICQEKNAPKKKMNKRDILKQNAALNAARRSKLGSKG